MSGFLKKSAAYGGVFAVLAVAISPVAIYAANGGSAMVTVGLEIEPVFSVKVTGTSVVDLGSLTPGANPIEGGAGVAETKVSVIGNGGTTYSLLIGAPCEVGGKDSTIMVNTAPADPVASRDEQIPTLAEDELTDWGGVARGWGYKVSASANSENVGELGDVKDASWRKMIPLTCESGTIIGGGRVVTSGTVDIPSGGDGDVYTVKVGAKIDERLKLGDYTGTMVFYGYEEI